MLRLFNVLSQNALCSNLPFTKIEWAHGILLVAYSKVEVFTGRLKSYDDCNCFEKNRHLNLSPFREIEPDQVKSLFTIGEREKSIAELGFKPVSKSFMMP